MPYKHENLSSWQPRDKAVCDECICNPSVRESCTHREGGREGGKEGGGKEGGGERQRERERETLIVRAQLMLIKLESLRTESHISILRVSKSFECLSKTEKQYYPEDPIKHHWCRFIRVPEFSPRVCWCLNLFISQESNSGRDCLMDKNCQGRHCPA